MNLSFLLARAVQLHPHRPSLIQGHKTWSYWQMMVLAQALGKHLECKGLSKGDRVAVLADNTFEYALLYQAAALSGFILVNLNIRLSAKEVAAILADSGSRVLFCDRANLAHGEATKKTPACPSAVELQELQDTIALLGQIEDLSKKSAPFFNCPGLDLNPDHPAHLYYTSGTTGQPKGVVLSHRNVSAHAQAAVAELSLTDRDTWLHAAPMYHLADAWALFALTLVGGRQVFLPEYKAVKALSIMADHQVTMTNMVPTMINSLLQEFQTHETKLPHLRSLLSGGAPISPTVVKNIMTSLGCDYVQTYGMTETSPFLSMSLIKENLLSLAEDQKFHFKSATGRPFMSVLMRVVDAEGEDVAPDGRQVGEILVRGETVTKGYWNQPQATAEVLKDGWLYTGDLAVLDSEGYINIVDRKKDMIITGGENVYSCEVENVLYAQPDVFEAAVYGVPDDRWGEAVSAAVVAKPGSSLEIEALQDHCRQHLAKFKVPRNIVFLKNLPKTGTGKISKRLLRQAWVDQNQRTQ